MLLLVITKFLKKIENYTTRCRILKVRLLHGTFMHGNSNLNRKIFGALKRRRRKCSPNFFLCFLSIGSIRVYCRVRPFLPGQASPSTVGSIDEGNITIVTPSKSGKEGRKTFSFNKVFGPSAIQGIIPCHYLALPFQFCNG